MALQRVAAVALVDALVVQVIQLVAVVVLVAQVLPDTALAVAHSMVVEVPAFPAQWVVVHRGDMDIQVVDPVDIQAVDLVGTHSTPVGQVVGTDTQEQRENPSAPASPTVNLFS